MQTLESEPITLHLPRLYPKQYAAIFADTRSAIIEASTKSGKTAGCIVWMLSLAWSKGKPGRNYWWIAPTYAVAAIAFRRVMRMFARTDGSQTIWKPNKSEQSITLHNGAMIWFKGADDPDKLYGEDVYAAVVDEGTRCKEEAWYAIRSTITATRGPLRIIGNVKGRKNWAYRLARKVEGGEPNWSHAKLTAHDAVEGGILSADEIEAAKRDLPENVFRELYLAEASDDGNNPFGLDAIDACTIGDFGGKHCMANGPVAAWGFDLAKSVDWTVGIGLNDDGDVCAYQRWQSDWRNTTARVIGMIGDTPALIDSTGVGDPIVEQVQASCPEVEGFKFTSQSKQQLMEGLAVAIQQRRIGFPDGQIVNELKSFEYEHTRTGVRYTCPEGLHDDTVDALALAVRRAETMPTPCTVTVLGDDDRARRWEEGDDAPEMWSEECGDDDDY